MKQISAYCLLALSIFVFGCGTPQPTNIMDSADKDKILEYEAMVAADSSAMSQAMEAKPESNAQPAEPAKK